LAIVSPLTNPASTALCLVQGYFYYIFGFLFLVAILTLVITIEVSIVCTYGEALQSS
jgi:hypothetical protein